MILGVKLRLRQWFCGMLGHSRSTPGIVEGTWICSRCRERW